MKQPENKDEIEARAAAWLIEEDVGLSAEQRIEYQRWLDSADSHRRATSRLRATWSRLQTLRGYRPGATCHPDPDLLVPSRRTRKPAVVWGLVAACLALGGFLGFKRLLPGDSRPTGQHYITEAGGYYRLLLPDGSSMEMNARTEVRVSFSNRERHIALVRGEGYFVVARDASRPFVVEANGLRVRAVGTEFNVRAEDQSVEVLVTHGRISLASSDNAETAASEAPIMTAGQRALIPSAEAFRRHPQGVSIETVSIDQEHRALAWQNPRLYFTNATLADVVRQFNQRGSLQIEIVDPALNGLSIGGSFRPGNVEAFLRLLVSANEISVERREPNRILLRRAPQPGTPP